ncbi:MAG: putative DNA helicase ino80, partial [Phylliscum demangeonii]
MDRSSYLAHSPTFTSFRPPFTSANASYERTSSHGGHGPHHEHPPAPIRPPLTTGAQSPVPLPPWERASSTFYDPTSDQGHPPSTWSRTEYPAFSPPPRVRRVFDLYDHDPAPRELTSFERHRLSPGTAHLRPRSPSDAVPQSHPPHRVGSVSQSPIKSMAEPAASHHHRASIDAAPNARHALVQPATASDPAEPAPQPTRTANPMSFSSILSSTNPDPPPLVPPPAPPQPVLSTVNDARKPSRPSMPPTLLPPPAPPVAAEAVAVATAGSKSRRHAKSSRSRPTGRLTTPAPAKTRPSKAKPAAAEASTDVMPSLLTEEIVVDEFDPSEIAREKLKFLEKSKKRLAEIGAAEGKRRKRRRTALIEKMSHHMGRLADAGEARFRDRYAGPIRTQVQEQEAVQEKERKKDMQRKRRREKTIQNERNKRQAALDRLHDNLDPAQRKRALQDAALADKKIQATTLRIQRGNQVYELADARPMSPNLAGGTMTSFPSLAVREPPPAAPAPVPAKKAGRAPRPRKSKEQKQAEKDAAEAAHAAMARHEPAARLATTDRRPSAKTAAADAPAPASTPTPVALPAPSPARAERYASKGYHQMYDQIWRDLARKDVPRVQKIKDHSLSTKQSNLRKTAQLASKEARRWQLRTNKSLKDVQARAKRSMRGMTAFWKGNEREEREHRRVAERLELAGAKRAEADREANRQRRKLNFLISQTELYSHFIGRKIKTDEVERSTDRPDVAAATTTGPPAANASGPVGGSLAAVAAVAAEAAVAVAAAPAPVTDLDQVDFDAADDAQLQAIAAANAQSYVQAAHDRARAFNQAEAGPAPAPAPTAAVHLDDGELNFQNPSSFGDVTVPQPAMLTTALKEYQLKGLNWLVNLYEQGINGILADEMGLGKTVQSISVMAYLAENHNIWGPFLVIAPASTLHNWQQEITRFVPALKVLPYWGSAKDRKVLRKFWDRKHLTYTQDSPFHVLVTSYQLVVQDAQYFQKVRWQYMILDEAQAIKSSQSSRWKVLLAFHCRNRLLLTGTPIQNNMQELWALLHFIMPSLFDSHDEFSDWFSKDIESHAQSHTKLNEEQLQRLHMILKPFMLRRIKKHVQKELGDKIELDVVCELSCRQRAYYGHLRNRISLADLVQGAVGEQQAQSTLMNLVMQFRKVCNHPDLFERAETTSPWSFAHFAETASFLREGPLVPLAYSTRSLVEYRVPRLVYRDGGRLALPGPDNARAGFTTRYLDQLMNVWSAAHVHGSAQRNGAFAWLPFTGESAASVSAAFHQDRFTRALAVGDRRRAGPARGAVVYDGGEGGAGTPAASLFQIVARRDRHAIARTTSEGCMRALLHVAEAWFAASGLAALEPCARPAASAPPVELVSRKRSAARRQTVPSSNTMPSSRSMKTYRPRPSASFATLVAQT